MEWIDRAKEVVMIITAVGAAVSYTAIAVVKLKAARNARRIRREMQRAAQSWPSRGAFYE